MLHRAYVWHSSVISDRAPFSSAERLPGSLKSSRFVSRTAMKPRRTIAEFPWDPFRETIDTDQLALFYAPEASTFAFLPRKFTISNRRVGESRSKAEQTIPQGPSECRPINRIRDIAPRVPRRNARGRFD